MIDPLRRLVLGPFALDRPIAKAGALAFAIVAFFATQIGGLAVWLGAGVTAQRESGRRAMWFSGVAFLAYAVLLVGTYAAAPLVGRVPLPCFGETVAPRSLLYCATARNFVVPELREELRAIAADVRTEHPDATVRYLDAAFPFPGVPLLPHLSHGDGRKVDMALFLLDPGTGEPSVRAGSPIGYFGYVAPPAGVGPACPDRWFDLRWDLDPLQSLFGPPVLDEARTASLLQAASRRRAIRKILIEPHLERRLGVASEKLRFQGCHAARHDDHIHFQVRDL